MSAALASWSLPKTPFTIRGVSRWMHMSSRNISNAPPKKPTTGEVNIGSTTFGQRPIAAPLASVVDQTSTAQLPLAVASEAPHRPPMSAWLELEGRPSHQVSKFQMMALINAPKIVTMLTTPASTMPPLMVFATAVPASAPTRLKKAASQIAWRGVRTLVETTVAIALAASWNPLMYSKTSAVSKTIRKMVMGLGRGGGQSGSGVFQHDLEHDLTGVARTVDGRFHQIVEFHEDDHFLGVVGSVVEVLDEGEHDLV